MKNEKHKIRKAKPIERTDCCGDRYPCDIQFVCSCGLKACSSCMEAHVMKLHGINYEK